MTDYEFLLKLLKKDKAMILNTVGNDFIRATLTDGTRIVYKFDKDGELADCYTY